MKKLILLMLLLSLFSAVQVNAVALGVNKASVSFNDVLRGGYAQDAITVTTDATRNISLEYEVTGDLADWVTLEPVNESERVFSRDNPLPITVIIQPPEDAANGVYTGTLRLLTGRVAGIDGVDYGSKVHAAFGVKMRVEITGEQIESCTAGGWGVPDTEIDYPLELQATVKNTGNVMLSPEFTIDIWDQYQTEVVATQTLSFDEILPTTQERLAQSFEQELPIGQYWAQISEDTCEDSGTVTFNVLDLGGVSDRGELLRIDNQAWAGTDDIVRIAAIFKNLGKRTVNAKFKGTVEKDDKVVEVIETDSLSVRPGSQTELESFFNPKEPGRYMVNGRVIYNNKLTFPKSSVINVQGDVDARITGSVVQRVLKNPYQVGMVFIILIIGVLLFLIRKERRRY